MKRQRNRRKIFLPILMAIPLALLTACAGTATTESGLQISDVSDLTGRNAGVMTGTPQDEIISAAVSDVNFYYYDSFTDVALALQTDKVDFFTNAAVSFEWMKTEYSDLQALPNEVLRTYDISMIFPKSDEGESLCNQVNEYIAKITEDGTLEELKNTWLLPGDIPDLEIPAEGENGVLQLATSSSVKPFSYIYNGKPVGFDIAVAAGFCREYGYGLQVNDMTFASVLAGISTGKYDLAAGQISYTEERAESVLFCDSYYQQEMVPIIRKSDYAGETLEYQTIDEMKEAAVGGVVTGTVFGDYLQERGFTQEPQYFNSVADMAIAVDNGKVDFFVYDYPVAAHYAAEYDDLAVLPEMLAEEDYYYILNPDKTDLQEEFNTWLAQASEDGLLEELNRKWINGESATEPVDLSALTGEKGALTVGVDYSDIPGSYYINNQPAGYNIDLIVHFCEDQGYAIDFEEPSNDAIIASLLSGKIDLYAGFMSYTEERAEQVLYTDSVYSGGVAIVVREENSSTESITFSSWWNGVKGSFVKSFITENRYQLVLKGLGITLLITVLGFLAANLIGALFCCFAMSKSPVLHGIAAFFNWLMQGTPMVVILMILYYVILGKVDIPGMIVAVIGFGLNTGAYLAQTFKGAIEAVDYGQMEASVSLGLTRGQAFFGIILPQAIRNMLVGYFSELISLMKGTAIVGYIAVSDLTKVGDIIRSSTYEAFFPLLAIAVIYLIITSIILGILSLVKKKLSKKLPPKKVGKEAAE